MRGSRRGRAEAREHAGDIPKRWDKNRTHPRNFIFDAFSFFTFEWARFGSIWFDLDLKVDPNWIESCKNPDQKVTPPFLLHLCTKMQISRSVMVGSSKFLVICKALNLLFRLSTTFIRQILTYLPASAKTCEKGIDVWYTRRLFGVGRQSVKVGCFLSWILSCKISMIPSPKLSLKVTN